MEKINLGIDRGRFELPEDFNRPLPEDVLRDLPSRANSLAP
jgi:hypothetical protein